MKRRIFIVTAGTVGFAGAIRPSFVVAAASSPCPPQQLGVAGGDVVGTVCATSRGAGVPAHIANAVAGQWAAIGSNTLSMVGFDYVANPPPVGYATNLAGIMTAWSGGGYDSTRHKLHVHGGGHGDYHGNEFYTFNLETNTWVRADNPTLIAKPNGGQSELIHADGSPTPIHTYDTIGVNSSTGKCYRFFTSATGRVMEWDPALASPTLQATKSQWRQRAAYPSTGSAINAASAWAPDEGVFYTMHKNSGTFMVHNKYNPTTDVWTTIPGSGGYTQSDSAGAYSASRRLFVVHNGGISGGGPGLVVLNCNNQTYSFPTLSQTLPGRGGLDYDTIRDRFIFYTDEGANRKLLYSIDPSTWAVTQISPAGGDTPSAVTGDYRGIYGRFAYCADYDVFIAVSTVSSSVYIYKPTGWSPP